MPRPLMFVATQLHEIPAETRRFASVDGTVPGATVVWDHHRSGEAINLDAMPDEIRVEDYDGVATTMVDADAVCSAAVFLLGGKSLVSPHILAILEAASFWCDHLSPHPACDETANHLGRGLLAWVHEASAGRPPRSALFSRLTGELFDAIRAGEPLPYRDPDDGAVLLARQIRGLGRLREHRGVAILDLTGLDRIDLRESYRQHACAVAVLLTTHRAGGAQYTVGVNPEVDAPLSDLHEALVALASEEFAFGPPCIAPDPVPGAENWGGRATVFGSPWNYGSRLSPEQVAEVVSVSLGLSS